MYATIEFDSWTIQNDTFYKYQPNNPQDIQPIEFDLQFFETYEYLSSLAYFIKADISHRQDRYWFGQNIQGTSRFRINSLFR